MGKVRVYFEQDTFSMRSQLSRKALQLDMDRGYIAQVLDINPSTLNAMWTGQRPFRPGIITVVCSLLGLEVGDYLDELIDDYLSHRAALGKRPELDKARQWINLAAKHDRQDLLTRVASQLLENNQKKYLKEFIEIGKEIYNSPQQKYSYYFFNEITKESDRRTELLSQALFYRFMLLRYDRKGADALRLMLQHFDALPFDLQPEALLQTAIYYSLRDEWEEVKKYALKLNKTYTNAPFDKQGHFLGYALFYQELAATETGDFDLAIKLIHEYQDINDTFKRMAIGNKMYVLVASGRMDILPDFISHLKHRPVNEQTIGLSLVLEQYVGKSMIVSADAFLYDFSSAVTYLLECRDTLSRKRAIRFLLALHRLELLKNQQKKAVDSLLDALDLALQISSIKRIKECILLIEQRKPTKNQKQRLIKLLKEDVLYA